jgi:hypothetical protein
MFSDRARVDCQFRCCDCVCSLFTEVDNSQVGVGWVVSRGRA